MPAARGPAPKLVDLALPDARPFRLGVLADTHRYSRPAAIPPAALERLAGCDAYVHCGDFGDPALLAALAGRAPLYPVLGNVDPAFLAPEFPTALLLRIGPWRVGAIHQAGASLAAWRRTAAAFPEPLDVLLFGHSHRPVAERDGRMVFLNPGSAVDPRGLPAGSVAVVELGEGLRVRVCRLPEGKPAAG